MKIAIASGKGGTGKTTITASLASIWPKQLTIVDMDVEEPNLHLFLNPTITSNCITKLDIPKVDMLKCDLCGVCSNFCQFSSITLAGQNIIIFPEMCHGCCGCILLCPQKAIETDQRVLGKIIWGKVNDNTFIMGKLRVGEAMSPPLMRKINDQFQNLDGDIIIDSPPGTSCPAMRAVSKSDIILLVTEPTPFGFFDLKLAYEAFSTLKITMGVIINRFGLGNDEIIHFCDNNDLPIIGTIPYSRETAVSYSNGEIIADISKEMKKTFEDLYENIQVLLKNRSK